MNDKIHIHKQNTNLEIVARITKAAAKKYGCSVDIDMAGGKCRATFVGDETYKPFIAAEVIDILSPS